MKNLLNKKTFKVFTVGLLMAFGMVIFASQTFAAGAYFNTDPQDYQTLRTGNYSKNGPSCSTCWAGSVMADAGDIVSFDIYYHNTSGVTANQTRVKANIPAGNFNSFTVTADLYAANATPITGTSLVNLTSMQNLTFIPGSVLWYPNQSVAPVSLLYGQSGNEIITTGLNLGDVSSGWITQGHVTFRVQVGGAAQQQQQQGQGQVPMVITNAATSLNQNAVNLNSSINPNGSNTTAWFEYGTTQSLGSTIGNQTIGNGNAQTNITTYLSGLMFNVTYYYRAVASNQYGTSYGSILSFTTSQFQNNNNNNGSVPIVATNSATGIYPNSATFNANVNPNNSNTTVMFEYGTTQSLGTTIGNQTVGSGNTPINISYQINSLSPNTTYYYRAIASNQYGVSYGSILSFFTQNQQNYNQQNYNYGSTAFVTTNSATSINQNSAVLSGSVNPNGSNATTWFEYGTTQSLGYTVGNQLIGSGSYSMNITTNIFNLLPNTIYYYRAVASNQYGTSYGNILSFSTTNQFSQGLAPIVTTNPANVFLTNSILLNGAVNANGVVSTAWFEYGTTQSLGQTTNSQPMGMGTVAYNYSYILSNLIPNTNYYFRAVAQNAYGTSYGSILNFMSPSAAAAAVSANNNSANLTTTVVRSSSNSLAVLLVSDIDKAEAAKGDEINYTAVYKNISDSSITNAKINIILPDGFDYQSANVNPSSQSAQNITFDIGKVLVNGQGSVSIKAKINNSVKAGESVLNAGMDYVDINKNSQSAKASSTIIVKDTGSNLSLTASLFDAVGSLFGSWVFNVILLAMIVGLGFYVVRYIKQ